MNEIDVSKYKNCPYWHYGHCQNNIINVLNSECSVHQNCFIKKTLEQLQQLKAENDELRARNSRGTLAFLEEDFKKEQKIKKYKQCLDEIEKMCKVHTDFCCPHETCEDILILQLIKQTKGDN